jgi:hypothetical protein
MLYRLSKAGRRVKAIFAGWSPSACNGGPRDISGSDRDGEMPESASALVQRGFSNDQVDFRLDLATENGFLPSPNRFSRPVPCDVIRQGRINVCQCSRTVQNLDTCRTFRDFHDEVAA